VIQLSNSGTAPSGAVISHSSGPSHSVRTARMTATRFGCNGNGTPPI